jgi:tetratricopeptide (TPR) repeat protein
MPSVPQMFFGRDAELAQIIDMIFTNVGSGPARIAILGPGGYGKTTLANAALTHPRVQEHYGDTRYMVTCESLLSSGALLIELAKTLGVFKAGSDASWSHIRALLVAKEYIICFDNFESPWDQPGDTKASVEDLLSRITELHRVTVIITMRGTERPARTKWTRPTMAPLKTLTFDAARVTWEHIADHYDDFAEKLINAVDCVPLAVNLLAHLAQAMSSALLWQEWNEKQIQLIHRGLTDRLSNLEYSIQLSIDSERMRSSPFAKAFLGILSLIPDGMHTQQLERFKGIFVDIDILSSLRALQQCGLINLTGEWFQTHPIIRLFCDAHGFLSLEYKTCLQDFYVTLGSHDPFGADPKDYSEMVLEVNNTKAILSSLLNSSYSDQSKLIHAVLQFTQFCISIGDHSEKLISQAVTFLKQDESLDESLDESSKTLLIQCLTSWGKLYYRLNNFESAISKLQEAEQKCLSLDNSGPLYGNILLTLGDVHVKKNVLNEAEVMFMKALTLYQNDRSEDKKGLGDVLSKLGNIYIRQKKLDQAETLYQQAFESYEASNNILGFGHAYIGFGKIYKCQNKLDKAEAAFQKALELYKANNVPRKQGAAYSGIGDVYFMLDQLERAETSYKKALELQMIANSVRGQGKCYENLGNVYFKQDKLDDAEALFQKALQCFKDADAVIGENSVSEKLKMVHKMLSERGSI